MKSVYLLTVLSLALAFLLPVNPQSAFRSDGKSDGRNPQFTDVAAQAGLTQPIIYGGVESKRYIIETNGCGVAFYDYDNDGWLDILTLNGSRLEAFPKGSEPTTHLYKNNRNGTFTDITKKAGFTHTGFASGLCI